MPVALARRATELVFASTANPWERSDACVPTRPSTTGLRGAVEFRDRTCCRCPNSLRCALNRGDCHEFCTLPGYLPDLLMCWNSQCKLAFQDCDCPPMYPIRCKNNFRKCAATPADCLTTSASDPALPFQCWNSSFRQDSLGCPCPAHAPIRCPGPAGYCAEREDMCDKQCFDGMVQCWDSNCHPTWSAFRTKCNHDSLDVSRADCRCPPESSYRCPNDPRCVKDLTMCSARCPTYAPIKCWDGTCAYDVTRCPCAPATPYRCLTGACVRQPSDCIGPTSSNEGLVATPPGGNRSIVSVRLFFAPNLFSTLLFHLLFFFTG